MASENRSDHDIVGENSNASGGDERFIEAEEAIPINPMVLLVRIEHINGRPLGPTIFTETTFRDLCKHANSTCEPHAVEILSPHEICITYEQGVPLGQVAGELMAIESWGDFPILVTVVIIKRSKVDSIVEVRQKSRQEQGARELKEIEKLKQGQYDLQEDFAQVNIQKEMLRKKIVDHDTKQDSLLQAVEQLTEKVTKLETQPLQTQGFMTSSTQNVSNFGNLSTSFQVKADIDIGKFSGTEPTPADELNFDQWCIDVKSYQTSYPDNILLLAIRKSIVGCAKSVIRHLGPSYTVDEIIAILTQEYEGVASSDVIFKDFYQLRQEKNEKVQAFSICLRDMLTKLSIRFPDRVPKEDHDKILKDRFFYGIKSELRNSIRHLYDNETITFSQLLVKARRNEEEESASRLVNKNVMIHDNTTLEQRVEHLIAKSNNNPTPAPLPRVNRDNSRNYGRPPFQSNQRFRRDYKPPQMDIRQNLRGPETSSAGPFGESDGSRPIQCFRCRGWGHPKRLCPSRLNYTWWGMVRDNPSPDMDRKPEGPPPQNLSPQQ